MPPLRVSSMYYVWVSLLLLLLAAAWLVTLFAFPGNWVMVALAALFAWLLPAEDGRGFSWITVGVALGLAVVGEILELFAGAAGAKKEGASRRAMLLALGGTMVGSIAGAFVSIPIPVVGPIIGALGGGAAGAFAGAYLGESWKGSDTARSMAVGRGAVIGRLLGTVGKLLAGALILVLVAIDAFL